VAARAALDRVTGTYNGVNVQSCQYTSEVIDFEEYARAYVITQSYDVRINRDEFEITQGTPVTGADIIDLADTPSDYGTTGQVLAMNATADALEWVDAGGAINELNDVGNVNIDDPLDRQALVYDEATDSWINDGVGSVVIPIRNNSAALQLFKGTVVQFAGTQGDRILVEPWDNASPSAYIVGVLSEPLAGGADGHAQTYGELRALDTSAYALDAVLYANASGTFTTTPNSLPIATVTRVHANTGRIFIRLYVPGDHYRDRFRAEARAAATASSITPATVETYYTAQANGDGHYQSKGSDTPKTEGDVVRRTIYWKAGAFAAINAGGFTEVVLDDDSTYAELLAAIDDILNANGAPITIWSKREEGPAFLGLLQEYPGAAAAYSLRLLNGDYAGEAIRIRRSGDNAEQDIGFDGAGELDRDAIANFCSPGDGFVKVWYDQSGNGNDATQTTTTAQPKIYDAATGVEVKNGTPNLLSSSLNFMPLPLSASGAYKIFSVSSLAQNGVFIGSNSSSDLILCAINGGSGLTVSNSTISEIRKNGSLFSIVSRSQLYTDLLDQHLIYMDAQFAFAGTSVQLGYNVAEGLPMFSSQEFIVYPDTSTHTPSDIESNINDYYDIY
jgi:hypothetical protein